MSVTFLVDVIDVLFKWLTVSPLTLYLIWWLNTHLEWQANVCANPRPVVRTLSPLEMSQWKLSPGQILMAKINIKSIALVIVVLIQLLRLVFILVVKLNKSSFTSCCM